MQVLLLKGPSPTLKGKIVPYTLVRRGVPVLYISVLPVKRVLFYKAQEAGVAPGERYSPPSEHVSPRRKVKSKFFGNFWQL